MIYFGMEPDPGLSAKMAMTRFELKQIGREALRKCCYESGDKYVGMYPFKGNKIRLGTFSTAKECNAAWDKAKEKYDIIKAFDYTGWQRKQYPSGTVKYSSKLEDGWKQFDTSEEARAAYEDMLNKRLEALGHGKGKQAR